MPAMEPIVAAATAIATGVVAKRLPAFNANPQIDAALKAAAGVALIFVSAKVGNGVAKGAVIGAGVGLVGIAAGRVFPVLA